MRRSTVAGLIERSRPARQPAPGVVPMPASEFDLLVEDAHVLSLAPPPIAGCQLGRRGTSFGHRTLHGDAAVAATSRRRVLAEVMYAYARASGRSTRGWTGWPLDAIGFGEHKCCMVLARSLLGKGTLPVGAYDRAGHRDWPIPRPSTDRRRLPAIASVVRGGVHLRRQAAPAVRAHLRRFGGSPAPAGEGFGGGSLAELGSFSGCPRVGGEPDEHTGPGSDGAAIRYGPPRIARSGPV